MDNESRRVRMPGIREMFDNAMSAELYALAADVERRDRLYDLALDQVLGQLSAETEEARTL